MAKCGFCIRGKYQRLSDPYPMPCEKCGGTGTLNEAPSASGELIHGMYHSLSDKLETVRSWPGVTGAMLDAALKEATDSGRIARFDAESPDDKGLNIVVSVYQDNAPDTLVYARARMKDTFGERFSQWDEAYLTHGRVRYLRDDQGHIIVPVYRNCVRIEVVDLFASWNRKRGMVPCDIRNTNSAHFAVLFVAAQDPDWVWAMDGEKVPYVVAGGLELNVPGYDQWASVPGVGRDGREADLYGYWHGFRYSDTSLPSLRE